MNNHFDSVAWRLALQTPYCRRAPFLGAPKCQLSDGRRWRRYKNADLTRADGQKNYERYRIPRLSDENVQGVPKKWRAKKCLHELGRGHQMDQSWRLVQNFRQQGGTHGQRYATALIVLFFKDSHVKSWKKSFFQRVCAQKADLIWLNWEVICALMWWRVSS